MTFFGYPLNLIDIQAVCFHRNYTFVYVATWKPIYHYKLWACCLSVAILYHNFYTVSNICDCVYS